MSEGLRILVLEDEWLIAEATGEMLTAAGYVVVGPVPTVAEALHLLDREPIDGAVLDVQLACEKSFPVAEALIARNLPFVFLSGFLPTDLPDRFRACPLVTKPARAEALTGHLQTFKRT